MELEQLRATLEGLLLISGDGLSEKDVAGGLHLETSRVRMVLDSLIDDYHERNGGIIIKKIKGKYKFVTNTTIYNYIQEFIKEKKKETLSKSMIETLAIIAYKQPITLFEIEEIRGVNSRSIAMALLSKKLIKSMGKKESPGRPLMYGTTREFLEYLGINSLDDLPPPSDIKEMNFEEI